MKFMIEDFLQIMNEQSEILIDLLIDSSSKKQNVDLYRRIGLCSLDIICGNNFFKVKINLILNLNYFN